jgi:hypothetical protein
MASAKVMKKDSDENMSSSDCGSSDSNPSLATRTTSSNLSSPGGNCLIK